MTTRGFLVRATAYAGYHLVRASERLQAAPVGTSRAVERTLAGNREIEWTWTLAHVRRGGGRVLDFGAGNGMMSLGAAFAGNDAVAVDLETEQFPFEPDRIEYVQGDFNELEIEPGSFDQIINCSSIEHVGLAGRYGSADDPDGDLRAMEKMARVLKPDGNMVLTISSVARRSSPPCTGSTATSVYHGSSSTGRFTRRATGRSRPGRGSSR